MVCQRCGTINQGGDQFCGNCGAVLASSHPQANKAPALPASTYGGPMDAPTVAQPLSPAQPTQYGSPPTQYVPPEYGPGGSWAASPGGYSPPPQATWAEVPLVHQNPAPAPYLPTRSVPGVQKRRRWPWYLLLFLVILGVVGAGSWILLLRPAVHQSVDGQIRQGLQQAIDQIPPLPQAYPPGLPFPVSEPQINDYLARNISQLAPITDMHVSLQPGVMVATFQAYGFGSTVRLGLAVDNGSLIATNVDVSGLLWWVESADDLTARFDDVLGQIPGKLGRPIASVSISSGSMQFTFG